MIAFPNCKINLGLNIISKRKDGYHNIETCMIPIHGLNDVVEIIKSGNEEVEFSSSGKIIDCTEEENICIKAYKILKELYGISGVKMHLHKNIPFGAGLGGGSSDAVTVLKLLNEIFSLNICPLNMRKIALSLGSDTVFFLNNIPAICYGRGDITENIDLNLKGYYLVLVKPPVSVSTAEAYNNIKIKNTGKPIAEILKMDIDDWKENLKNDFEDYVFGRHPELSEIKDKFYDKGAVYASMSGSGSAIYGIFKNQPENINCGYENYALPLMKNL